MNKYSASLSRCSITGILIANFDIGVRYLSNESLNFKLAWYASMLGLVGGGLAVLIQHWRFSGNKLLFGWTVGDLFQGRTIAKSLILNYPFVVTAVLLVGLNIYLIGTFTGVSAGCWMATMIFLSPACNCCAITTGASGGTTVDENS